MFSFKNFFHNYSFREIQMSQLSTSTIDILKWAMEMALQLGGLVEALIWHRTFWMRMMLVTFIKLWNSVVINMKIHITPVLKSGVMIIFLLNTEVINMLRYSFSCWQNWKINLSFSRYFAIWKYWSCSFKWPSVYCITFQDSHNF